MLRRLGEKSSGDPRESSWLTALRSTAGILLAALIVILILGQRDVALSWSSDGNSARVYNQRGLKHINNQEHGKAIESFQKAIQLEPREAEYHFNLATLLAADREASMRFLGIDKERLYAVMMSASRKAWLIEPDDTEFMRSHAANIIVADEYGATPDWEEAVKVWERYLASTEELLQESTSRFALKFKVKHLLILAESHLNAGRPQKAQVLLDRATTLHPKSNRAPLIQARIHAAEDQAVAGETYRTPASTRLHAKKNV